MTEGRLWLPELKVGLGLWQGCYKQIERLWIRWYDEAGNWFPTPSEQAALAQKQVMQEQQRADTAQQLTVQEQQRADAAEAELA